MLDRQTATADILRVISASPGDLSPVFDAVITNATRLCGAEFGTLVTYDGGFHGAAVSGLPLDFATNITPGTVTSDSALDRLERTKHAIHVHNVQDDPAFAKVMETSPGFHEIHTLLAVPMLNETALRGAIIIYRKRVQDFTEKEIALVTNFAAQAVIAIENARLLSELRESLDRQTATADILRVIASTPGDPRRALDTIAETAARMFDAASVAIRRTEGDVLRGIAFAGPAASRIGRTIADLRVDDANPFSQSVRENRQSAFDDFTQAAAAFGSDVVRMATEMRVRTVAFTPLTQEGRAIGAMAVLRDEVRPFQPDELELMKGFADQAVIAIENARLLSRAARAHGRAGALGRGIARARRGARRRSIPRSISRPCSPPS